MHPKVLPVYARFNIIIYEIQPDATIRRLMQSEGKPARAVLRALDSIPDVTLLNDEDWHAYLYLRAKARYELKRIQRRDTVLVETMEYFNAKGKPAQAGLLALCTGRAYASKVIDDLDNYKLNAKISADKKKMFNTELMVQQYIDIIKNITV